jgi:hypothetical protein
MTFLRDIAIVPLAGLTVTIMGSISGVRPAATRAREGSDTVKSMVLMPVSAPVNVLV